METPIKPQTFSKSQLAEMYRVHPATFKVWIDEIPNLNLKRAQKILTPKQVKKVFDFLGEP